MNSYSQAGMYAGAAGLTVFLLIHHFFIRPIWFILPIGLILAIGGGLAVGWSYRLIEDRLPRYPWTFLGLTVLIMLILTPAMIIAEFTPAPFGQDGSLNPAFTAGVIARQFIVELILTAIPMGALVGWVLGRSKEAVLATATAGFIYALGPGHNIPFLGNMDGTYKGILYLLVINLVSAFVMMVSLKFKDK
jgi:hypothetical protein